MRRKTKPEITVDGVTFYSTERAAKVLGVHYRTLMSWVKQGALRVAHVGQAGYIPAPELRRLLTEGTEPQPTPVEPARPKPIKSALLEVERAAHRKEGKGAT
jgi:excisionase family DNA binding protein